MSIPDNGYIIDASRKGYTIFDNWLFDCALTCAEKMVYIVLKSHAWSVNRVFPAHSTIARKSSLSISTVKRALKSLIEAGLIRVMSNKSKGASNIYYLCDPTTTEMDLRVAQCDLPGRSEKTTGSPPRATNITNKITKTTTTTEEDVVYLKELEDLMNDSPFCGVDITTYLEKTEPSDLLDRIDKLIFTYQQSNKHINKPAAVLAAALRNGVTTPDGYIPFAERRDNEKVLSRKRLEAKKKAKELAEKERAEITEAERRYKTLSDIERESLRARAKQLIPVELRNFKYAVQAKVFELIIEPNQ